MATGHIKELSRPDYWNERYSRAGEGNYDWLRDFSSIRSLLVTHLPPVETNPVVLHLGCGNSVSPASFQAQAR